MFYISICVIVIFILFVEFVLGLEIFFFCPILFFYTFRFMSFISFFPYTLMRNWIFFNWIVKLLTRLEFIRLVNNGNEIFNEIINKQKLIFKN